MRVHVSALLAVIGLGISFSLSVQAKEVRANWGKAITVNANDGDVITFIVPKPEQGRIIAKITDQAVGSTCEIHGIESLRGDVRVTIELVETGRDSGWNGCYAEIRNVLTRNGRLRELTRVDVEIGYGIDD